MMVVGIAAGIWLVERVRYGKRPGDLADGAWALTYAVALPLLLAGRLPMFELPSAWWKPLAWFVVLDLGMYWVHRAGHDTRIGWAVHSLHHSARELGSLSVWRVGPIEWLGYGFAGLVAAVAVGASGADVAWGAAAHLVVTAAVHGRWVEGWRWMSRLGLVSPKWHHWHHVSGAQHNFASALRVWDFAFGTASRPPASSEGWRYGDEVA